MGGKTWTLDEESCFWILIIPMSPRAAREEDRIRTWTSLASIMQAKLGIKARRKYTPSMLSEHYFQNITTGHMSPNAQEFVEHHMKELEDEKAKEDERSKESEESSGPECFINSSEDGEHYDSEESESSSDVSEEDESEEMESLSDSSEDE